MKTICLNMIVKNENKAIRRLLKSARSIIDYWVIVDTGSTDGTQEIIREALVGIPGELHERPWVHFAHNRNEALQIARKKADFILILDADHQLIVSSSFKKEILWQEFYLLKLSGQGSDHYRPLLINNDPAWIWEGVIHETMVSSCKMQGEVLKELSVDCSSMDGWRAQDPKKYYRDAEILEKALEEEPFNSRYVFYLAESYDRVHEYELALKNYEKRAQMDGEPAETFWTLFCIGTLQEKLGMDPETVIRSYCKAYEFDPTRAEPFHRLSIYLLNKNCLSLSYIVAKFALDLKTPNVLNTNYFPWVYEWGLWGVIGDCACSMNHYNEARDAYRRVLNCKGVPLELRKQVEANLRNMPNGP
jgi:glycosyltransferase involved in cell wall biosynthesis